MSDEASPKDAALRALGELIASGGWRAQPAPPGTLVVLLAWPDGTVDTLAVRGVSQALAERTNPAGHPVWRQVGTVLDVIAEVRALPAPDTPDAPRHVIGGGGTQWAMWTP